MVGLIINTKIVLLLVAVLAIGLFALPSAVAMFGGQHEWYDLGAGENQVPCEKCHADIYDEMNSMPAGVGAPHRTYPCTHCHRTYGFGGDNYVYADGSGSGSQPGQEAHAASTVECMECHDLNLYKASHVDHHKHDPTYTCGGSGYPEGSRNCHDPPRQGQNIAQIRAGGFGLTSNQTPVSWPEDTGEKAAHRAFVMDSINNSDLMEGANEACITCHTHVAIDINWTHAYKMSLDADGSSGGDWIVENFITEGTYNVTTYGNMSGETRGVTDPVIEIDPEPIGYIPENP
ncbi:MAG: hypothetical protein SVY15_05885 [Halobacteriota archaeon]|nr:hypothetical protein [Halobacteriota archaeon]